jgi:hypothetical protein
LILAAFHPSKSLCMSAHCSTGHALAEAELLVERVVVATLQKTKFPGLGARGAANAECTTSVHLRNRSANEGRPLEAAAADEQVTNFGRTGLGF